MNDIQRRIVAGLAGAVALVFIAVGILALANRASDTTTTSQPMAITSTTTTTTAVTAPPLPTTTTTTTTTTEATTSTTDSTTTTSTSTTTTTPADVLILGSESIDGILFGTDAEAAIGAFQEVLGAPSSDTGWVPPVDDSGSQVYGPCPGTEIRVIDWPNLTALFTNGATAWGPEGTRHFFHYSYFTYGIDTLGLRTAAGVGLGATADDLRNAYGEGVQFISDEFGDYYTVSVPAPGALWGFLDGPDGNVVSINGGEGCGE